MVQLLVDEAVVAERVEAVMEHQIVADGQLAEVVDLIFIRGWSAIGNRYKLLLQNKKI